MSDIEAAQAGLARRLGTTDAVVIGLGSMLGAGVFSAFGPATRAAGGAVLLALGVAALVAYCNATSSAQLAALFPQAGGTYVYGRQRLGPFWGFLAGWGFVVGKLASCAAMALTFGAYVAPSLMRPLALGALAVLTGVNYFGIRKTAQVTRVIVAMVLAVLSTVVAAIWWGGATDLARAWSDDGVSAYGVLQGAGFLFFAFAGYARIATLGAEVIEPERTIVRAIPLALGIALMVYAVVLLSALAGAGHTALGASATPLSTAVEQGRWAVVSPLVRAGAGVASLGVLLSLIAGVSRTLFAMAENGDLPPFLRPVHPRYRVPHRAELAVGAAAGGLVAFADLRGAIGFSSFAVLVYYAIANAAAWTLPTAERRWPRWLAGLGFCGCLAVALALPAASVIGGALLLGCGALAYVARRRLTSW